jgi:hypothetical protein
VTDCIGTLHREADRVEPAHQRLAAEPFNGKVHARDHFEPSNPRMAGGANVQPLLIARP